MFECHGLLYKYYGALAVMYCCDGIKFWSCLALWME